MPPLNIDPTMISTAIGAAQSVVNLFNAGDTKRRISKLLGQRRAFETPEEIFDILNATQFAAQGDTATRDYQTNQLDSSFSNALNTAQLLGSDPNALSSLFGQKIQGLMQVGQQFHTSNMEAFGKYLGALNTVAENDASEQISRDNLIKDRLQAEGVNLQNNYANINNGINTVIGGLSAAEQMKLYQEQLANNAKKIVSPLDIDSTI